MSKSTAEKLMVLKMITVASLLKCNVIPTQSQNQSGGQKKYRLSIYLYQLYVSHILSYQPFIRHTFQTDAQCRVCIQLWTIAHLLQC